MLLCNSRAVVTIQVEGVDKYAPVFEKTTYTADMEEDRLYDNLIQVKATDQDKGTDTGAICSYEMLTKDAPFVITNEGMLSDFVFSSYK